MQEIKYEQESGTQSTVCPRCGPDEFRGGKKLRMSNHPESKGGGKMHTIELTESQVIRLLEQGKVDGGNCWIVNIDKEVTDHDPW